MKPVIIVLSLLLGVSFITAPAYSATDAEIQRDIKDPKVQKAFQSDVEKLLKAIQKDKQYNRIPLDTKKSGDWFSSQMFLLWDHNISKSEFVKAGLEKYPSHKYEFDFVADRLSRKL